MGSFFTIKRHVLWFTMARKSHFSPRPARGVFHILRYHENQLWQVVVKNAAHGEKRAPCRGLRDAARIRPLVHIPPLPANRRFAEFLSPIVNYENEKSEILCHATWGRAHCRPSPHPFLLGSWAPSETFYTYA